MNEKQNKRFRPRQVKFYLSDDEFELLKSRADFCKLSLGTYLRKIALEGHILLRNFEALREVNRIGVNINQIARRVNEKGEVDQADFELLKEKYEQIFAEMYKKILLE